MNLLKDKKGQIEFIFVLIVVAFVTVAFFVGWTFLHGQITAEFLDVGTVGQSNITSVTQTTFSQVNNSLPSLQWIAMFMIFGIIFGIFIGSFFIREHPWLFIPYFLVIIAAVILSIYISNAYEIVIQNETLTDTFSNYTAANYFFFNLPLIIGAIGLIGLVILFIRANREPGVVGELV